MLQQKKNENEEIIKIIGEIDEILGTETNIRKKVNGYDIMSSMFCAMGGSMIPIIYNDINPISSAETKKALMYSCTLLGAVLGYSIYHLKDLKDKYGFETMREEYEYAYTRLSRKEQIAVLEKEKELLRLASHSLKYKRNIDMAYSYLKGDDSKRTFFENLDYEHPYHILLSTDEEKRIHDQGLLTPEEAVKYWESTFSKVCIPSDEKRCARFKDCHDCLVNFSENRRSGWEKMHFCKKTLGPKPRSNK